MFSGVTLWLVLIVTPFLRVCDSSQSSQFLISSRFGSFTSWLTWPPTRSLAS